MAKNITAKSRFEKLVNDIVLLYTNARRAQVKFAWETGRRIVEEEQDGEMHAAYGSSLIIKLSEELTKKQGAGFSETNLRKMRNFYLRDQKQAAPPELDWAVHAELLPVKDEKVRKRLESKIIKEGLNSRQVRKLVHDARSTVLTKEKETPAVKTFAPLKCPTGLKLGTFSLSTLRVKLDDNYVLVDCGFFVSWPVKKDELKAVNIVDKMSYAYAATIDRVVDGDTLLVLIEAGFGIIVHERLRFRGVNCPELGTVEGTAAKKYVEHLLRVGTKVVIKSSKGNTDIYGRFVVDVFYKKGVDDAAKIIKDGVYLNQELLDKGFAVRMD